MKNTLTRNLFIGACLAATTQTIFCQGTFYTSRPVFEGVLSSSSTVTFEELPSTAPGALGERAITSSGITVTTPDTRLYVADPNGWVHPIPGAGKYIWNWDGGYPITVILPEGVTAFGADFSGSLEPNPSFNATLTVHLVGGGAYEYHFTGDRGMWTFFGVTFPEPIANIVFNDGGAPFSGTHEEMLDNATYGVAIPEPGGLALLGVGSGLLWAARRRRLLCAGEADGTHETTG